MGVSVMEVMAWLRKENSLFPLFLGSGTFDPKIR